MVRDFADVRCGQTHVADGRTTSAQCTQRKTPTGATEPGSTSTATLVRLRLSKERSSSSRPTRPERACHDPRRVAGLLSYNELSPHVCIRPAGSMRVPSGGRYVVLLPFASHERRGRCTKRNETSQKGGYGGSSTTRSSRAVRNAVG